MRRAPVTTPIAPPIVAPLSRSEFDDAMMAFAPFSPLGIALAVSGGPDSMALAACAKSWALEQSVFVRAFIVDHALRADSGTEAEETKKQLEHIGIPTDILRWEHGPVLSRLHITARKARYKLLIAACQQNGMDTLLLGHQCEDQAETILMRFAKGSGIDGLAGIAPESRMDNIRLLRPFLNFPKERLIATCKVAKMSYVVDPSNQSDKYARGRLRRVMPLLADEGLTQERLCGLGTRAAEARDALNHYMKIFLQTSVMQDEAGVVRMDLTAFYALPKAVAERALTFALQTIHREDYAPEHQSLVDLIQAVRTNHDMPPRTLHGCLVSTTSTQLVILREYAAIADATIIHPGETIVWDGRWRVTLPADAGDAGYTIRPLGNPPHDVLDRLAPGLRQKIPQGRVRASLPALWTGEKHAEYLALIPMLTTSSSSGTAYAQVLALQGVSPPIRSTIS